MSIHPSLRGVDTLSGNRSVLSRVERLQKLIHDGKMTDQDSPFGLPKVRTAFKVKSAKKADAEDTAGTPGGEGTTAEGESPTQES